MGFFLDQEFQECYLGVSFCVFEHDFSIPPSYGNFRLGKLWWSTMKFDEFCGHPILRTLMGLMGFNMFQSFFGWSENPCPRFLGLGPPNLGVVWAHGTTQVVIHFHPSFWGPHSQCSSTFVQASYMNNPWRNSWIHIHTRIYICIYIQYIRILTYIVYVDKQNHQQPFQWTRSV